MTKHEQILSLLPAHLDEPITANGDTTIYEIEGSGEHGIWLRLKDFSEIGRDIYVWYELEETDLNYDMVANVIIERLTNDHAIQS
jgi:hypothetical protein